MNHLVGTLQKPLVSFLDGIVMGGGCGISVHGPLRIVTENTVFAMPENAIGFFPDVGMMFKLSRMGAMGLFLGLTGFRVTGHDALSLGIGTHFVPSHRLADLKQRLCDHGLYAPSGSAGRSAEGARREPDPKTYSDSYVRAVTRLKNVIDTFCGEFAPLALEAHLGTLQHVFSRSSLSEIRSELAAVSRSSPDESEFSESLLKTIGEQCPLSLHTTVAMHSAAKRLSFKQCLELDNFICSKFLAAGEFQDGVHSRLIEKKPPVWRYADGEAAQMVAAWMSEWRSMVESAAGTDGAQCIGDAPLYEAKCIGGAPLYEAKCIGGVPLYEAKYIGGVPFYSAMDFYHYPVDCSLPPVEGIQSPDANAAAQNRLFGTNVSMKRWRAYVQRLL